MINLFSWFTSATTEALGWTLLHFLWQGAVLAILLYCVMAVSRSAVVRYTAGVCTLALMAIVPGRHVLNPAASAGFNNSGIRREGDLASSGSARELPRSRSLCGPRFLSAR